MTTAEIALSTGAAETQFCQDAIGVLRSLDRTDLAARVAAQLRGCAVRPR